MKATFAILASLLMLAAYHYWPRNAPPVAVATPSPSPTPKPHRLAPTGIYYTLQYLSTPTKSGVIGFPPGQRLRRLEIHTEQTWLMSDGQYQVEVDPATLTDDLDLADAARTGDERAQAALTAQRSEQAKQSPPSPATTRYASSNQVHYTPTPTPANPLDRSTTPTNRGRQAVRGSWFYPR